MPLRALQGETNVLAYEKSDAEWEEIRQTYREKDLRMPCCSSIAVPKTSSLGNHFFSHYVKGTCTSAPESPEHIYLKTTIAKAAVDVGWGAITEYRGSSPSGAQWVADVYCTKDNEIRVVEVQLSGQSPEEFVRRQKIYIESNVKAIWLASKFNRKRLRPSLELPVFELEKVEIGCVPMVRDFELSLSEFMRAVLSGRLTWRPDQLTLLHAKDECWRCREVIYKVRGWIRSGVEETTDALVVQGRLLSEIRKVVGVEALRALGLCVIESSEEVQDDLGLALYYNACPHCGALQNNWARMAKSASNPIFGEVVYKAPRDGRGQWKIRQNAT